MLRKYQYAGAVQSLLYSFPESMHDVQYFLWMGDYESALQLAPDNEQALAARARNSFDTQMYADAAEDYDRLLLLHPDKMSYMLNKSVCLVNMGDYEEALRLLYQLDYEHSDDKNIRRVLAWALTCDHRLEQAAKIYQQLTDTGEQPSAEDYLNYGYCLWLSGDINAAADRFKSYVALQTGVDGNGSIFDDEWLHEHGISPTQVKLMQALVLA